MGSCFSTISESDISNQHSLSQLPSLQMPLNAYIVGKNNSESSASFKHLKIINIPVNEFMNGNHYMIICNHRMQMYFVAGHNQYGQCAINTSQAMLQPTPIEYFKTNNIKIKKVCVNNAGYSTFWITEDNDIYCHGRNDSYQLGINHNETVSTPQKLNRFANFVMIEDIKTNHKGSMALCTIDIDPIIHIFCNKLSNTKIIDIITKYHGKCCNQIYASKENMNWIKLDVSSYGHILKIECTEDRWYLLNLHGVLWFADNDDRYNIFEPISYFTDNSIKIFDITCGLKHILAADDQYRLYSWGCNEHGQLGHVACSDKEAEPKLIEALKHYKMHRIDSGLYHSYCKTRDDNDYKWQNGKHFLWGNNEYNECLKEGDDASNVSKPFCINELIEGISDQRKIRRVELGSNNTKIFLKFPPDAL